jgi:hypothetical protein
MSSDKFRSWSKSSLSSDGNCVEVAFAGDGSVGVRDSKQGEASPVLEFTSSEWEAFVGGIASGELSQS